MTQFLTLIGHVLRTVLTIVVATTLLMIVVLVFYQVITRYVTGAATPEIAEISRFLFIWSVFAGAAWLISRNELIAIDFFSAQLGPRGLRILRLFVDLCTAALLVALVFYSAKLLDVVSSKHAPATGIPYIWVYAALPVFASLSLFFLVERAFTTRLFSPIPVSLARER